MVQHASQQSPLDVSPGDTLPGGWPDVIELDKNAQTPKQTHTWRVQPEGVLRAPPPHPSASMRRHSNMTNTTPIYVLLFGNPQSRLPPPTTAAIMELAYIFAGAGTLNTRNKHPT